MTGTKNWYTGHRNMQIPKLPLMLRSSIWNSPQTPEQAEKVRSVTSVQLKAVVCIFSIQPIVSYFKFFEEKNFSEISTSGATIRRHNLGEATFRIFSPMYIHVYTLVYVYTYIDVPEFV